MDDMNRHLDEGTLHAWLDGALAPDESARVERHAASCAACAALVAEARGLVAASSRILSALDGVPGDVIPGQPAPRDLLAALRARRAAGKPAWWRRREFLAAASLVFVAGTGTVIYRSLGDRVANSPASITEAARGVDAAAPRAAAAERMAGDVPGAGARLGAGATAESRPVPPALPSADPAGDRQLKATVTAAQDPAPRARDLTENPPVGATRLRQVETPAVDSLRATGATVAEAPRNEAREAGRIQTALAPGAAGQASAEAQMARRADAPVADQRSEAQRSLRVPSSALAPAPVQRLANEADFAGKGTPPPAAGLEECYELGAAGPGLAGARVPDRIRIAPVPPSGDRTAPAWQAVAISGPPGTTLIARPIGDVVELLVRRDGDSTVVRFRRSAGEAPPPPAAPGTTSLAAKRIRCGG